MIIDPEEFKKLDLRVCLVKSCEQVPGSRNLYKIMVDCGEKDFRQIVSGIAPFYSPEELIGQKIIILVNLKPKIFMGIESQGMLLAADVQGEPFLLKVEDKENKEIPPGTRIR